MNGLRSADRRTFPSSIPVLIAALLLPLSAIPAPPAAGESTAGESTAAAPEERFWLWFSRRARELYYASGPSDPVIAELQTEIARVHPLLVGVVDGIRQDGRRIFIISAGGKREGFGAVRSLARATPRLAGWKVCMYVPGRIRLRDCTVGNIDVRASDVRALLFRGEAENTVNVHLLFPGYTEERDADYNAAARRLLFDALGEYELATRVESIFVGSADSPLYTEAIPYQGLPTAFNAWWYGIRRPR